MNRFSVNGVNRQVPHSFLSEQPIQQLSDPPCNAYFLLVFSHTKGILTIIPLFL